MRTEREFLGGKHIQEALIEFLSNRIDCVLASITESEAETDSANLFRHDEE